MEERELILEIGGKLGYFEEGKIREILERPGLELNQGDSFLEWLEREKKITPSQRKKMAIFNDWVYANKKDEGDLKEFLNQFFKLVEVERSFIEDYFRVMLIWGTILILCYFWGPDSATFFAVVSFYFLSSFFRRGAFFDDVILESFLGKPLEEGRNKKSDLRDFLRNGLIFLSVLLGGMVYFINIQKPIPIHSYVILITILGFAAAYVYFAYHDYRKLHYPIFPF